MGKKKSKKGLPALGFKSPVAERWPKTDRLILERLLKEKAQMSQALRADQQGDPIQQAHAVLVRWADFETSGKLAKLKETQLLGDFLGEVFGQALGFARAVDGATTWELEQHHAFGPETPDATIGRFSAADPPKPLAVVELKGPTVDLDRDRSNGRTAVDQGWDYLVNQADSCRWAIVSNLVSFRLYERGSTKRCYEHFTLQSLRDPLEFKKFYVLFSRHGLLQVEAGAKQPWALQLLAETRERQRTVGDELYNNYSQHRLTLIEQLHFKEGRPLDEAIEMAQRLFDRVFFIAFCEDRGLLPTGTLQVAATQVPSFSSVTNPRWQNFKNLFRFVDRGSQSHGIHGYNGGLFAEHSVDALELDDDPYTNFFRAVGGYDFRDEVNLDVLGHLFERSITELEKLKESGLFGGDPLKAQEFAQMPQSAKRKQLGVYYTPPERTSRIVQYTVDELIAERYADLAPEYGVAREEALRGVYPDDAGFWRGALAILRDLRIVDPACGSGAFLFQAYDTLESRYVEAIHHLVDADIESATAEVPHYILGENLYGVDLSPEAVEITQLALWIRSAAPGQSLETLTDHIVHGNSLVHDPEVAPHGFDWRERFPEVFARAAGGFDCVIGNPPWERADLSEREFFSLPAPAIATATTGAKRKAMVALLEKNDPKLFDRYTEVKSSIDAQRSYFHLSGEYPLTGTGRTNFYAVFAELASKIVSVTGRVGLLVPSGIATDNTTKEFFASVAESNRLIRLFDFENKKVFFPEVHASFRFCILIFGGADICSDAAAFVFFAHGVEEVDEPKNYIQLSGDDIKLLNPNTRTCPIFVSRQDANLTKAIYRRVPVLLDKQRKGATGNPWQMRFKQGLFNQTSDSSLFREPVHLKAEGLQIDGHSWTGASGTYLPVYEAKMFRPYDHRHGSVFEDTSNWINQGQTHETTLVQHQNPEYLVLPRWWVASDQVLPQLDEHVTWLLAFRDITRATDVRTLIAAALPICGPINAAPLLLSALTDDRTKLCLLASLNSMVVDFVAKTKTGGTHMNFFIVEQLPILPPHEYAKPCPWDPSQTLEDWVSERVFKLTCTAEDMLPLADACGFTSGSFQAEYGGRLNRWDEAERTQLMAELDAAYLHLYGLARDDAEYVLGTFKGVHEPSPLTPGRISVAENVLRLYDEMG